MGTSLAIDERHPSSLTDWLRTRTDDQLAELLRRRPDLALPAPADLAMLASRLSVRTSVQRAIDALDAFALRVLDALVLSLPEAPGADVAELGAARRLLGDLDADEVERAIGALSALGLVWGGPDRWHLVATVRESLGHYPAGLGRPAAVLFRMAGDVQLVPVLRTLGLPAAAQPRAGAAVAGLLADPERLAALLASVDADEREILDRLADGPPIGTVRNTNRLAGDELPPPHRLLARGLLVALDTQTVELPREVGLALRTVPVGEVQVRPPDVAVTAHAPAELDRMGTTAVLDVLRLVAALANEWAARPPAVLRAGGLGVRELRRAARDLGVDESTAAVVAEVAHAAGLIGSTNGIDPVYLPTIDFDSWVRRDSAARWADLTVAWLAMSRQPHLVNRRGDRDRLITALGPDVERGTAPSLRAQVLDALTALPPGAAPRNRAAVLARLAWQSPRRAAAQRAAVEAVLAEADLLGVTAAGGVTGYSRTLLAGTRAAAEQVLAAALPVPVDSVLVQPDLTIVVPGPPEPALAAELASIADLESSGGAHVFRVTESSVRRALDAGRPAGELHAVLAQRSRTPIPQGLTYLIDDVARRHGVLRAGAASAYLRCDDEVLLSRVLADRADRALAALQLRRIAPTVVISTAPVPRVLEALRAAGYAPAAEAADGEVVTLAADAPRAPSRSPVRVIRPRGSVESDAQVRELVRRVRAGDSLTELSRTVHPVVQQVPGVTSATTMALLRQAIREGRRVLIGSADPDGTASRHTILPISLAGGFVRGHEPSSQRLQSFPLHRLTAVRILDDDLDEFDGADAAERSDEPS
ncbi:MAG: hypothetical protein QOE97_3172 [Pseudonocardiales bacterium]|nr:hypothetical protein [Pseudonocardiales bacterium]